MFSIFEIPANTPYQFDAGAGWVVSRLHPGAAPARFGAGTSNAGSLALTTRSSLALVRWQDRTLLLGVTPNGISLLTGAKRAYTAGRDAEGVGRNPSAIAALTGPLKGTRSVHGRQIFILLTLLSVRRWCWSRDFPSPGIVVVLWFLRQALGTRQSPSTKSSLRCLVLVLPIMTPVCKIEAQAVTPYYNREDRAANRFNPRLGATARVLIQANPQGRPALFMARRREELDPVQVAATSLIPAFVISELKTAFQMAFMIYIPFLILDLVVAAILMSMGMMFLPPVLVSLPFKLVLFVLVDGWNLLVGSIVRSFA